MGKKFDERLPHMPDEELEMVDERTLNATSKENFRREKEKRIKNQKAIEDELMYSSDERKTIRDVRRNWIKWTIQVIVGMISLIINLI